MNTIITKCSPIPGNQVATLRVPRPQLVAGRLLVPGDCAGPEHNLLSLQTLCASQLACGCQLQLSKHHLWRFYQVLWMLAWRSTLLQQMLSIVSRMWNLWSLWKSTWFPWFAMLCFTSRLHAGFFCHICLYFLEFLFSAQFWTDSFHSLKLSIAIDTRDYGKKYQHLSQTSLVKSSRFLSFTFSIHVEEVNVSADWWHS